MQLSKLSLLINTSALPEEVEKEILISHRVKRLDAVQPLVINKSNPDYRLLASFINPVLWNKGALSDALQFYVLFMEEKNYEQSPFKYSRNIGLPTPEQPQSLSAVILCAYCQRRSLILKRESRATEMAQALAFEYEEYRVSDLEQYLARASSKYLAQFWLNRPMEGVRTPIFEDGFKHQIDLSNLDFPQAALRQLEAGTPKESCVLVSGWYNLIRSELESPDLSVRFRDDLEEVRYTEASLKKLAKRFAVEGTDIYRKLADIIILENFYSKNRNMVEYGDRASRVSYSFEELEESFKKGSFYIPKHSEEALFPEYAIKRLCELEIPASLRVQIEALQNNRSF